MKVKLEGLLYILGGLLHLMDFLTDLWYVYTQPFNEDWMYYGSVVFLACPSIILFLIFLFMSVSNACAGHCRQSLLCFVFGLVSAATAPFGIVMCGFGMCLLFVAKKEQEFYIIEGITRTSGVIEGIFESLPQLILQSYNNTENSNWDLLTATSVCLSAGGFLYTYVKLLYALDKIKDHEDKNEVKKNNRNWSPSIKCDSEDAFELAVSPNY